MDVATGVLRSVYINNKEKLGSVIWETDIIWFKSRKFLIQHTFKYTSKKLNFKNKLCPQLIIMKWSEKTSISFPQNSLESVISHHVETIISLRIPQLPLESNNNNKYFHKLVDWWQIQNVYRKRRRRKKLYEPLFVSRHLQICYL